MKETPEKKWPREILGARSTRKETLPSKPRSKTLFHVLFDPRDLACPFFLAGFFCSSLDGLSERGTSRSLILSAVTHVKQLEGGNSRYSCKREFLLKSAETWRKTNIKK